MSIKDAIMATIYAEKGSVKGRTLLQKKLYFVAVLSKEDFGVFPHYYGPYSSEVSDQLGALVEAGFVNESIESFPGVGGPFGESRRYNYTLAEAGEQVLKKRNQGIPHYKEFLERVNKHPISNDPKLLSIAAKSAFHRCKSAPGIRGRYSGAGESARVGD